MINWIKVADEIPEEGKRLLYFFEGTGVWVGFYYGRDEDYPDSNNHVFASNVGFLTGDVTHWCYIDYPEGEDAEWELQAILEQRINRRKNQYLVKYKGYKLLRDCEWRPEEEELQELAYRITRRMQR